MRIKCIGGEQDGYVMTVEDNYLHYPGQIVDIPAKIKSVSVIDFNSNVCPGMTNSKLMYAYDEIKIGDGNHIITVKFLRPVEWSVGQVLQFQFGKI